MAYKYRKMTPAQRVAVVRHRKDRGYPHHSPPHPYRVEGCYFITGVNFEHAPIMGSAERRSEFAERLLAALQQIHAEVYGWVIVPNHYHTMVGVESLDLVSSVAKELHGSTAREWNLQDNLTGRRQVWYRFADRRIRGEAHWYQALNYIHFNPVKHGYASRPQDWQWSSVHRYIEEKGKAWLSAIWKEHHPRDFGKGWDD